MNNDLREQVSRYFGLNDKEVDEIINLILDEVKEAVNGIQEVRAIQNYPLIWVSDVIKAIDNLRGTDE